MKRVLVTGSSRGIGKAIALKLNEMGFELTLHYAHNDEAMAQTKAEFETKNSSVNILKFDLRDRQQCLATLNEDVEHNGAYYGVVCNAGMIADNAFPLLSDENWDAVIHTNLDGLYNVLKPLIMPMIHLKQGGRIITMSSVSGLIGNRGQTNYAASKAGIIGASKSLALELAKRKITVNCVAPGLIETEMMGEDAKKYINDIVPMRRLGRSEEVAELVGFLMSEKAGYITRQVISINGGMV